MEDRSGKRVFGRRPDSLEGVSSRVCGLSVDYAPAATETNKPSSVSDELLALVFTWPEIEEYLADRTSESSQRASAALDHAFRVEARRGSSVHRVTSCSSTCATPTRDMRPQRCVACFCRLATSSGANCQ